MNDGCCQPLRLIVSGPRACFRRPEFHDDLVSYDVMPPTVARQLLRTLLGGTSWSLDRILVCNPIRYEWDRLTTRFGAKRVLTLVDVAYVLEARLRGSMDEEWSLPPWPAVHLGLSDYPATAQLATDRSIMPTYMDDGERVDLGWMIYDTRPPRSRFFRAIMRGGAIDVKTADGLLIAS